MCCETLMVKNSQSDTRISRYGFPKDSHRPLPEGCAYPGPFMIQLGHCDAREIWKSSMGRSQAQLNVMKHEIKAGLECT